MRNRVVKVVGEEQAWIGDWIYAFMNKRRIRIMINRVETEEKIIGSGTPQGSPLSPILFAICLSEALEKDMINYINDCIDVSEWSPYRQTC